MPHMQTTAALHVSDVLLLGVVHRQIADGSFRAWWQRTVPVFFGVLTFRYENAFVLHLKPPLEPARTSEFMSTRQEMSEFTSKST